MSAKPGSWRGGFCRRARVQTGVRCFHRVGCEKSGTAGCPPNMESGAGFGRRQKFEQPLFRQPRLFRSVVRAFFAKRRAANPARPGRAHGAKRRKQIFLKRAAASAALSLRSAFRLWRRSRSARFAAGFACLSAACLCRTCFFITDVRETGFMARELLPPRKSAAGCALFSPCRL